MQPLPALPLVEPGHQWALVLAGGSGTRLASLTTDANGCVVPKQDRSLLGGRSLLGDAVARGERLVARERLVVVVAEQHARYWSAELNAREPRNIVVQPHNRGTAPGILLPLLSILRRDPQAQVVCLPSDHFVEDEAVLDDCLLGAMAAASNAKDRVLLVGIEPDCPESEYGWIRPGRPHRLYRSVRQFVEKPDRPTAESLLRTGAVWNSFLLVSAVRSLLRLYERRLPRLLDAFVAAFDAAEPRGLEALYERIPALDFSRELLKNSVAELGLRTAPACGWTDLGTPGRVAQCATRLATKHHTGHGAGSLAAAAVRGFAPRQRAAEL